MARGDNEKKLKKANKKIQNIASGIQSNMDSLYTSTYFSTPRANNDVKFLADNINDNIDRIISRNQNTIGMPSVSVLYTRIFNQTGQSLDKNGIIDGINKMFEDPMMMDDLYATFMNNRFIRELDDEIDTVCKYMPKLEEALSAKKDSVLSSDHFSKNFLNIKFPVTGDNERLSQRIEDIKKKYKLQKLAEEMYDDTAKYGEKFVYIVPYEVAIARLLANKPKTALDKPYLRAEATMLEAEIEKSLREFNESYVLVMDSVSCTIGNDAGASFTATSKPVIMQESTTFSNSKQKKVLNPVSILDSNQEFRLNIEINTSGIIDSAITEAVNRNNIEKRRPTSLRESFIDMSESALNEDKNPLAKGNLNVGTTFKTNFSDPVNDGLIGERDSVDIRKYKVSVPGAVVKFLKREYVIPIYIEESCMGYYYIELRTKDAGDEMMGFRNLLGDPMTGMSSTGKANFNNLDAMRQDETIKYVAGQLSQFIDKKFVNANQDLAKEIYEILKYNDLFNTPSMDLIKVTFVPPEDIYHSYFNFDTESHRGISDLAKGLIPAKLFSSLYITNAIGIMTRGQDKRVYRVKQTVDTNIAQQLMNVINQIKMGNFGIRQFNSINTILNITGKFNDFVIPMSSSNESPIDIDVLQGQQFDIHSDLMDILEEMAINSTEVPIEIIQTRQSVDYASQLSMSSSKFLRTVYKRQERYQEILSPIVSAIYSYEYGEKVDLDVTLPPPVFLDMANTNQLITNTKDFVQSIMEYEMQNEQDEELKAIYANNLFLHYIGTHIDISAHKQILEQSKIELKEKQKESQIATPEQPEEGSGGDDYGW